MAKLIFKNEGLKRVLAISEAHKQFKRTLEETMSINQKLGRDPFAALPAKHRYSKTPSIWLVKDSGIYIMSAANAAEYPADKSHVCYAKGFDPRTGDIYEKCRAAVGGDDMVESIPLTAQLKDAINKGYDIIINITPSSFTLTLAICR